MSKFELLYNQVVASRLIEYLRIVSPSSEVKQSSLLRAHCADYVQRFCANELSKKELRRLGIPWSEELRRRTLLSPQGTILAVQEALRHGIACHLAGGTHHAHRDSASGFCIFNDLAIAALHAVEELGVDRVLIFDLDVHQGDGTAAILEDEQRVFTVSVHGAKNFPVRKAVSDLDIPLDDGVNDAGYLAVVEEVLSVSINSFQPELVIYDAGVDIFKGDPLGRLGVSFEGIYQRDRLVLEACKARSIPVATVIGGGYDDDRQALAERHELVVRAAVDTFIQPKG